MLILFSDTHNDRILANDNNQNEISILSLDVGQDATLVASNTKRSISSSTTKDECVSFTCLI